MKADRIKEIQQKTAYPDSVSVQQALLQVWNECEQEQFRHCAFQYYNGHKMVSDKHSLTLEEAKELWNEYYADMVKKTTDGEEIEVAIWINMQNDSDYRETLVHLSSPEIRNGKLYEPKYYDLF